MRWIRQTRFWWLLGLLLLIGSLVGAHFIQGPRSEADRQKVEKPDSSNKRSTNAIVAVGYVDTEFGQMPLFPSTPGEVVEVFVKDGDVVKKGKPLFRIDSYLTELQLKRAQVGVDSARRKIEQAKKGLKEWELQVETQKAKIDAANAKLQKAEAELKYWEDLIRSSVIKSAPQVASGKEEIEAAKKAIIAEEKYLEVIEAKKPVHEQELANDNLKDALNLEEQAKLAVDKCTITAPSDGTVVRVTVQVGNKFGQQVNANVPPLWFRPKGELIVRVEVDQEFAGRVKSGQEATIYDAANSAAPTWKGRVTHVADVFMPPRDTSSIPNPFAPKQENVLECRVSLDSGQEPYPRINQRVRVRLGGD